MRTILKSEIGYIAEDYFNNIEDARMAEKHFPKCNIINLKNHKKPARKIDFESKEYIEFLEAEIERLENLLRMK